MGRAAGRSLIALAGPGADSFLRLSAEEARSGEARRDELDAALLDAHARGDRATLVTLYTQAGDMAQAQGDCDAMCFYLTHAYVYALETGAPEADGLHARLKAEGREE